MATNFYQRVKKDIQKLKAEKIRLEAELAEVNDALGFIGQSITSSAKLVATMKTTMPAKKKRTMSASARRKIAAFQKARWAKINAAKKK